MGRDIRVHKLKTGDGSPASINTSINFSMKIFSLPNVVDEAIRIVDSTRSSNDDSSSYITSDVSSSSSYYQKQEEEEDIPDVMYDDESSLELLEHSTNLIAKIGEVCYIIVLYIDIFY